MKPAILSYLKYSIVLHAALFAVLICSAWLTPKPKVERLKFVVLPKGTGMDHVLTKQVVDKMARPPGSPHKELPAAAAPTPSPQLTPEVTATPAPVSSPTPVVKSTPSETPSVAQQGTPAPTPETTATPETRATPQSTATPHKTPEATPPPKPTPTATPKTQPSKSGSTPKPAVKASPTASPGGKQVPKEKQSAKTISTPKQTPKPTPKQVASVYDLNKGESAGGDARLPKQTPEGAVAVDEATAGKQSGVPGVTDGVEGAPLALNANQSALPQLYTNRAIMLLQRNFIVPEGVNDPALTCIVEWEILSDGTIQTPKVVKSTGNEEYDRRALEAVQKTGNMGPLPPQFHGKSVWVSLPFIYGQ